MELRDRLLQNAKAQVAASEALSMGNEIGAVHFLGPTLLLLGFAVELFEKVVLLDRGTPSEALPKKPFGHDLWSMWQRSELSKQRQQAELLAIACSQDLDESYFHPQDLEPTDPGFVPNLVRNVPKAEELESQLRWLSQLHTSATGYALRYPVENKQVPEPMLLICVFDRLIRNYECCSTFQEVL